jgi:hypothetical protein
MPCMKKRRSFLRQHSLVLVLAAIVVFLLVAYSHSDQTTHLGTFYGNAIADWLGALVVVIATKYFYEAGSAESRQPHPRLHVRLGRFLVRHSLTLVLLATGAVWVGVYTRSDVDSKYGAVVGNIVSQWTQILGLVLITKYAWEVRSKEGQ